MNVALTFNHYNEVAMFCSSFHSFSRLFERVPSPGRSSGCRAFVGSVVFLVTPCEFPIFLNIGHMRQGRLLSDGGPRCHKNTHRIGGSRQ